jgi:hypothetical protein
VLAEGRLETQNYSVALPAFHVGGLRAEPGGVIEPLERVVVVGSIVSGEKR